MRRSYLFGRWGYVLVLIIGFLCMYFFYSRSPLPPEFAKLFPDGYYTITHPGFNNGSTITVNVPPELCTRTDRSALECLTNFLEKALPSVLSQVGVPRDQIQMKVDGGLPILVNLVALLLGGDDFPPLTKRSIWSDIGSFFGDIGCGIAAALVGYPLFMASAAIFSAENNGLSVPISDDQNFFIFPVHGDIATSGPVRMFYQATRPVGFNTDKVQATTFNRDVYTAHQNARTGSDPNFVWTVQAILLHELTHVLQYRDHDYNLNTYALEYCFQYCDDGGYPAGVGQPGMPLEVEAFGHQNDVDDLLQLPGFEFYQIWSSGNLAFGDGGLGFPVQRSFATLTGDPRGTILELWFQYGLMQIIPDTAFRTFNSAEGSIRAQAQCSFLPKCSNINRRNPNPQPMPPDGPPHRDVCIQFSLTSTLANRVFYQKSAILMKSNNKTPNARPQKRDGRCLTSGRSRRSTLRLLLHRLHRAVLPVVSYTQKFR
jgi:hypothetical protein